MNANPLLWLHWRIMGSARTNLIIAIAYAGLIMVFNAASIYIAQQNWGSRGASGAATAIANVNRVWLIIMAVAQAAFILLIAPSAVRKAVQRDCDSGMIDSLRLSPMSNLRVVFGYLTGAPIQAFTLYGISLLFGTYFTIQYARLPGLGGAVGVAAALSGWFIGQLCLLIAGATVAALTLLIALATSGKGNLIGIMVFIGIIGGWAAVIYVPGIALLTGVMSASVIFSIINSGKIGATPDVLLQAATLQSVYCAILIAAACAKFRRPDRPIFTLPLGLLLTAIWGATLIAGMLVVPQQSALYQDWPDIEFSQYISSAIVMLLFAFFPLLAGAVDRFHNDRARAFGEERSNRLRPLTTGLPLALTLLTAVCARHLADAVAPGALPPKITHVLATSWYWITICLAIGLCLWTHYNWLYCVTARNKRIVIWIPLLLGLINGLPLFFDGLIQFIIEEVAGRGDWTAYGYISAASPFGVLTLAHLGWKLVVPGLGVQLVIALHAAWLAKRQRSRLGAHENNQLIDQDIPPSVLQTTPPADN